MTAVEVATVASPIAAALVGIGQVAVVAWGIRAMIRVQDSRGAREDARAEREDARHAEVMRELDSRAAREDARAEREDARHRESMEALRALIHGMETVIARTAPKGDTP